MIRDNWKQQLIVNVLKDEIGKCREEIASYNNQFLASSAMCAVLAALASVICMSKTDMNIWKVFYVLPTAYFWMLYNLIKYTGEQLKLNAYRTVMEHKLNQILGKEVLNWGLKIPQGFDHVFYGAIVQVFIVIPLSAFMLWGFWNISEKNFIWRVIAFSQGFQIVINIIMAIKLISVESRSLEKFGYRYQKDGNGKIVGIVEI